MQPPSCPTAARTASGLPSPPHWKLPVARGQLRSGLDLTDTAELLTLLAYGVNLRSRSGARRTDLNRGIQAALQSLRSAPQM